MNKSKSLGAHVMEVVLYALLEHFGYRMNKNEVK